VSSVTIVCDFRESRIPKLVTFSLSDEPCSGAACSTFNDMGESELVTKSSYRPLSSGLPPS